MGTMEQEIKIKDRKQNIQKLILGTIYAAGTLGVALVMPNILSALNKIDGNIKRRKDPKYLVQSAIGRLKEKGLIQFVEHNGSKVARLTKEGKEKLDIFARHNFKLAIPKRWDGRWRVVIFDIKESRKKFRAELRMILSDIGFIKLQNSVWVFPYDCEDLLALIKTDYMVGKEVLYMVVEKIENDHILRRAFGFDKDCK